MRRTKPIYQKIFSWKTIINFCFWNKQYVYIALIWSDSISNLFIMEFIFKCENTSFSGLLLRNGFRNLLQSVALSASSDSSESHRSNFLLKLSKLCQLKTLNSTFTKISLNNFLPFWFNCNFPLLKWFLSILVEWSIR